MALAVVANWWFVPAVSVMFRKKSMSFVKVATWPSIACGITLPLVIFCPYVQARLRLLGAVTSTFLVSRDIRERKLRLTSGFKKTPERGEIVEGGERGERCLKWFDRMRSSA